MDINDIPKNQKVIKPWGSEYKIYSNSVSSTKLLRINPGKSTSLHCHPIKKTGFVLIKGAVDVNLGFYNTKKLSPISRLMIRPGLFHCTKNLDKDSATILEIETPINKDDLVRFKDDYGRENKPYEDKKSMIKLDENDPLLDEPKLNSVNEYSVDGVKIKINKTNDVNQLLKLESNNIVAVLDGGFESEDNQLVLSPGDIVGLETIKKLAEAFKIQKYITYLTI